MAWTPPSGDEVVDSTWTPPAADAVSVPQTAMGAVQAGASGLNAGVADLAGLPVDTARNIVELGKAGAGVAWHEATGRPIPEALQPLEDRTADVGSSEWFKSKQRKYQGDAAVDVQEPTNLNWYAHAGAEAVAPSLIGSEGGTVGALRSAASGAAAGVAQQAVGGAGLAPGTDAATGYLAAALTHRVLSPRPAAPKPVSPTPDVGAPLTGDDLRAQPNPIPYPEGTLHRTMSEAGESPAAPPSQTPAQDALAAWQAKAAGGAVRADSPEGVRLQHLIDAADAEAQRHGTADENGVSPVRMGERIRQPGEGPTPLSAPAANGAPTSPPTPPEPTATQPTAPAPPARPEPPAAAQKLFNEPAKEGPQATPSPEQQQQRAAHLDAVDKLSNGALPTRRESALNGDYNATGDDYQAKEVGSAPMRQQIASENDALHKAAANVHQSIGSEFGDSVDSTTLDNRGRVIRNAIQGIQDWFEKATNDTYDEARAAHGTQPMPQFLNRADSFLKDDANYMPDSFRRSAQARLQQLKTAGDNGDGTPNSGAGPGSVAAAEKFREWLNANRTLDNAHVVKQLKDHVDTDVSEQGGPGLFQKARDMRTHQAQMLENPTGIKKLLTPSDSQGINHAIPTHKVADYISDLPTEQHQHVMNVLRAGAHLGDGGLADASAAAIRELQAHVVSRAHAAATNADGSWNARKFYNSANQYARNAPELFKERPDVLKNLQTINDAGNTLHMDKHYPGAEAQKQRTGFGVNALTTGGNIAASLAHEVPVVGRYVGRAIEHGVEKASGKMEQATNDSAVKDRLIDRNGNRVGSGKPMNPPAVAAKPAIRVPEAQRGSFSLRDIDKSPAPSVRISATPQGVSAFTDNGHTHAEWRGNDLHVKDTKTAEGARGNGEGTARLEELAKLPHAKGGKLISDHEVSAPEQSLYEKGLAGRGYDVQTNKHTTDAGNGVKKSTSELKGVYEVGPKAPLGQRIPGMRGAAGDVGKQSTAGMRSKQGGGPRAKEPPPPPEEGKGSTLNVGLHQGTEGQPGFSKMSKQEAQAAVESTGAKVTKNTVLMPKAGGPFEPTSVMSTDRPLTHEEMQQVLAKTKQSAIPQRTDAGVESMHVAPGHEAIAKAEGWDKFSPDYFREHNGQTQAQAQAPRKIVVPSSQRGSFSFQNDNELNRATGAARDRQRGAGIEPRNERNERVANQQMGGKRPLSAEQNEILRRLSGTAVAGWDSSRPS